MGVFAEGLLHAAPARIPGQVQHRRVDVVAAAHPSLSGDDGVDLLHQGLVPGAGQGDRLGKAGRAGGHEPMHALLVEERGDAQAGLLDEKLLDGAGQLGRGPRRAPLRGPPELADSVREQLGQLAGEYLPVLVQENVDELDGAAEAVELSRLLRERHAAEQVGDPFFYGKLPVSVGRLTRRCGHVPEPGRRAWG